jgi:hypothetical protein
MNTTLTLTDARKNMQEFLADMSALKEFADPSGDPDGKPFVDAFEAARDRALLAAKAYLDALAADAAHPRWK